MGVWFEDAIPSMILLTKRKQAFLPETVWQPTTHKHQNWMISATI